MRFRAFLCVFVSSWFATLASAQDVGLRMILVKTEAEARELRGRIQKGEPFEELARKYSADTSASAGGYLGTFAVADLKKEFQDGLSGLHAGDVSAVLRINGGYVLLQLLKEEETRWQQQMAAGRRALQQKQYAEAERFFQAATQSASLNGLGEVGASLNDLAAIYRDQANYSAAEPLYQRALAIAERGFGREHPNVGAVVINLAGLYADEKKYEAAEPLYKRALAIYEKAFGPDDPRIAERVVDLAELYLDQGNSAAAGPLYKRAIAIVEKNLGPNHPDLAASLLNLALLYENQGNHAAAEPLNRRARDIYEQAAAALRKNGQIKEAEEMELRARAIEVTHRN